MISSERIRSVCELFFKTKALMIRAEEVDNNSGTFPQPTLELKAAFDHVMRALAREYGITQNGAGTTDAYVDHQLDKSIGHIYRAYFDTADWVSISLREQLSDMLSDFDHTDITAIFPIYFAEIKPRFIDYEQGISALRNQKDIAGESDGLFLQYESLLERMYEDVKTVSRMVPSLSEYAAKRNRKEKITFKKDIVGHWIKFILTNGVFVLIGWCLAKASK